MGRDYAAPHEKELLGRHRAGMLLGRDLARPAVQVGVDHRRDVERQKLRNQKAARHRQAQGTARFRARACAKRDGQRAHQGRHGGHHDRAEAQQASFKNERLFKLFILKKNIIILLYRKYLVIITTKIIIIYH